MVKITAVIPIRSGSQRVKDKNLRPFAGTTLMENKVEMLLNVPELDSIIVNTNSEEAIEIVKNKWLGGVKCPFIEERNIMLLLSVQEASSSSIWEM